MSLSVRQTQTWGSVLTLPLRLSVLMYKLGRTGGPPGPAAAKIKLYSHWYEALGPVSACGSLPLSVPQFPQLCWMVPKVP